MINGGHFKYIAALALFSFTGGCEKSRTEPEAPGLASTNTFKKDLKASSEKRTIIPVPPAAKSVEQTERKLPSKEEKSNPDKTHSESDDASKPENDGQSIRPTEVAYQVKRGEEPLSRYFEKLGGSPQIKRGCAQDSDCIISCVNDGSCCDDLCWCSQTYNRTFASQLEAQRKSECAPKVMCPMARCQGKKNFTASCDQGLCRAVQH